MTQTPVVVVGGGAAGMMAALAARRAVYCGKFVCITEKY